MIENLSAQTWAVALSLLALLPAAAAVAEHHGDDADEPPRLAVQGEGQVRAEPDQAVVRLGVTAQAETAGAAQQQVNRVADGILSAVRALGVEERAVQTSQLSLYPVYSERQRRLPQQEVGDPEIVGYRASNVVSVRLEDLAKIGPTIDGAVKAGANEVQGVDFSLQDDLEARKQALAHAVTEARAKAEAMAAALGLRLGPVIEVTEGGASVQPRRLEMASLSMRSGDAGAPVSPGDVAVRASVSVVFALEGR
ncbi:MAG TPA: SIMPL domain-containing protein [Thermoanaerobaculia bacterium]|nr:SIMPL domain-containing protein [Thermoanaerobaculia bacterium]